MMKRRPQIYSALILFKQDIRELIQIFQNNLQNVLIVVDGHRILDGTQLEQFDPMYQATSLIARGYCHEIGEDDPKPRGGHQLIELVMSEKRATLLLTGGNTVEKAEFEVSVQIKKVLSRCQNRVLQFLQKREVALFFFLPFSLMPVLQDHHVDYLLQIFLIVGSSLLLIPLVSFFFVFIVRRLHMETRVFLFPGATRATHMYGLYETIGRLVISLVLFIAFTASLLVTFHMFWR